MNPCSAEFFQQSSFSDNRVQLPPFELELNSIEYEPERRVSDNRPCKQPDLDFPQSNRNWFEFNQLTIFPCPPCPIQQSSFSSFPQKNRKPKKKLIICNKSITAQLRKLDSICIKVENGLARQAKIALMVAFNLQKVILEYIHNTDG